MRRALAAAVLLGALLAGCGGEDESERLIPATRAAALRSTLGQIEEARSAGRCIEARSLAQEARRQAEELPPSVDRELRRSIRRGISRIFELLPAQCRSEDEPEEEEPPPTATEPPVETQPPPTEVPTQTTAPTTTQPPTTTTTPPTTPTPTPTTPTPAPGSGGGGGSTGGASGEEDGA